MPAPEFRSETDVDLTKFVEGGEGIHVIRGSDACRSWNNIRSYERDQEGLS
jgi:hypothetical protein